MSEISDAQKKQVLEKIGRFVVDHAITEEGLLNTDSGRSLVNWREAETWAKKNAPRYKVEFEILHEIIKERLKEIAHKVINNDGGIDGCL
jgi:hypothetical protein